MQSPYVRAIRRLVARGLSSLVAAAACLGMSAAGAVTITVKGPNAELVNGFRYTVQEDPTFEVVPDKSGLSGDPVNDPTLALSFHRSHAKVVKVGHAAGSSVDFTPPDATKRYFVTVMPDNASFGDPTPTGYTMNGTAIRPGASAVTVPVNKLPFKTAQISVFVFEDNHPVNGAPDSPGEQEPGLCGFEVQLFEAGGTYGASGGRVSTDTFGNPLGTEYKFDASGNPVYDTDPNSPGYGSLLIAKPGSNQLWTDRNGVVRIKNLSPAKYTIYSIPPNAMPSVARCNFADAAGNPTSVPIWIATESQRTRPDQLVWNSPFEITPSHLTADQSKWHQTTTIEGTWGVDAWVKAGEPTFFKEFGPPGHHVWHGFIRRFKDTSSTGLLASGGTTVTGKVVSTHMSRPPGIKFFNGAPMASCWVGITEVVTGTGLGRTLYANSCDDRSGHEGEFSVAGLRPGQRYQLNVWDEPLDNVIANYEFTVPCATQVLGICISAPSTFSLNEVPVFSWFSNLQGKVFYDKDGTGFPLDATGAEKPGIPNSIVNIRFRDGSIYQSVVTDDEGHYEFPEFFPFFNWMVAETDFTRFKATGATVIADNGGAVVNAPTGQKGLWPDGTMAPQAQPENGGKPYRIFGGLDATGQPVAPSSANLLQAVQGFLGQTNVIHWGKKEYSPGDKYDHGGITGVVHYASTRAEFDPKFAVAENNEPGIPGVEIRLYKLDAQNRVISPTRGVIDRKIAGEQDAVQVVVSDSFDKAQPENCVDPQPYTDRAGHTFQTAPGQSRCYDGMRIWNQVRDGVFDGGWAFVDRCPDGSRVQVNRVNGEYDSTTCVTRGGTEVAAIALEPGRYMTEGVAPYGYEHQKEEDKNVDFGDLLAPGTLANPAECLGDRSEGVTYDDNGNPVAIPLLVPGELSLFPGVEIPERFQGARPYCNKKLVVVAPGMNPFSDFHMFAKAPVAGHIVGMILDDLANEFDPYAPSFGEKYAPPFMPISIRDYAGNEINRVYSDRYGTYNALVPSTFAYNVPLPSGVAPNMVNVCLNSPTMKDANGNTVLDPHYNPQYSQYCYTFQYLPGKTTYLDTPVLPIAAFAGPSQYALDCEQPDVTPGLKMATGTTLVNGVEPGPWVPATGATVRLMSQGDTQVSNPAYDQNDLGTPGAAGVAPKNFTRKFGFGATRGKVLIGGLEVPSGNVTSWTDAEIAFTVPPGTPTGQTIEVVHANGRKTPRGITLHIGTTPPITVGQGAGYGYKSIQDAIDAAPTGALITVAPGVYEEAPIVWKRVRVQGYGAPATIVNAAMGAEYLRQQAWRTKVCDLVFTNGMADALVEGQTLPANRAACLTGDTVDNAPLLFATEEASGFFVLQKRLVGGTGNVNYATTSLPALQIDGFTVTGADTGGGIVANGHAAQLQISNNRITGNQGLYNGGIRIGHADLEIAIPAGNGQGIATPGGANSPLVNIHHNEVLKNGNLAGEFAGGGGGISMYTGASGYRVAQNYVCGNFSTGDGGGMLHYGRSSALQVAIAAGAAGNYVATDNRTANAAGTALTYASTVVDNQFRFNQSFSQSKTVQGGGLAIMGIPDPTANNGLSSGSGNVVVANNTFQGNLAGAGDGGGIALVGVNGTETTSNLGAWFRVDVVNNVIVNNGAGVAGGGISLLDSANVHIVNNTVSFNDSYATAARAFANGDPTQAANGTTPASRIATSSLQNGAGIAAYAHSTPLRQRFNAAAALALGPNALISNAEVLDTVVLGNRRFQWQVNYNVPQDQTGCRYDATGANPCFGLGHVVAGVLQAGPAPQTAAGNDIAVLGSGLTLQPRYSVFTARSTADGTQNATNSTGVAGDFASWYVNGQNGALKQLVFAVEQSVVKGAPVGEVQEPTVATTAAAFDEGGNFIDVRFGPLTRGSCTTSATFTAPACTTGWTDFGLYNPASPATGSFSAGQAQAATGYVGSLLQKDRNGNARNAANWVRGALAQ